MTAPLKISSTRQLFLDDQVVERRDGVERQFHRPVRYDGNPVLEVDRPWEGRVGVYLFGGTVLYDESEKVFKMWYRTARLMVKAAGGEVPDTSGAYSFEDVPGYVHPEGAYKACYAVSSDGLSWKKPDLGMVDFEGSTRNNIIPPDVGAGAKGEVRRPNLIKDYDDPDPGRRYKMSYMDEIDGRWTLAVGYSPDGIRWRMNAAPPTYVDPPHLPHGVLFGWDPRLQEYVIHHRKSGSRRADVDGREVRSELALVASTSPDFEHLGSPREIIEAHEHDPLRWDPGGHIGVMAAMLYTEDLYVGVLDTCLTHHIEDVPDELWDSVYRTEHAQHETELVISRDGYDWTRVAPHWSVLRSGLPGAWDSGTIGLSKPMVWNDQILFYYSGKDEPDKSENPTHPSFGRGTPMPSASPGCDSTASCRWRVTSPRAR